MNPSVDLVSEPCFAVLIHPYKFTVERELGVWVECVTHRFVRFWSSVFVFLSPHQPTSTRVAHSPSALLKEALWTECWTFLVFINATCVCSIAWSLWVTYILLENNPFCLFLSLSAVAYPHLQTCFLFERLKYPFYFDISYLSSHSPQVSKLSWHLPVVVPSAKSRFEGKAQITSQNVLGAMMLTALG
jgi:hypothetical protein